MIQQDRMNDFYWLQEGEARILKIFVINDKKKKKRKMNYEVV